MTKRIGDLIQLKQRTRCTRCQQWCDALPKSSTMCQACLVRQTIQDREDVAAAMARNGVPSWDPPRHGSFQG
jgi:hypothetical protein